MIPHPAWLEIDTDQFQKNLLAIRELIGNRQICLPVKANAYGHGLCEMSLIAEKIGIEYLGVSCLKEAHHLRNSGIKIPIIIFGAIHEDQIDQLIDLDCQPTLASKFKAHLFPQKLSSKIKVHLEIDTGMRRTGVRAENGLDFLSYVESLGRFKIESIYTHFATSDTPDHPFAFEQIKAFYPLTMEAKKRGIKSHMANSGGTLYYPDSYFDMVRPGLLAYEYTPNGASHPKIKPCLSLKAKISYFKAVPKETGISYNHLYRTDRESRIVTVPLGYADGYRRSLSQAQVLIRGKKYPIAGNICMDQFMVDIGQDSAYVGDEVTLIGKQNEAEITLVELAKKGHSIPHEMLASLSTRLTRRYGALNFK